MPPREDLIAFLDLETTGPEVENDNIIEVGISLINWPEMKEVDSFTSIVLPTPEARLRMNSKEVVREMHRINGLADEIDELERHRDLLSLLPTPAAVDLSLDQWLKPYGTKHIPLGGSGVSHFDRPFIKRFLPKLSGHLSYWAYDIGVLRRMFMLVGATPANDDGKNHRALQDARTHADEFRYYIEAIKRLKRYDDLAAE